MNKIRLAFSIFSRFHGVKGKIYAIAVIINEARKSLVKGTGIELNVPIRFRRRRFDALSEPVGLVNLWALEQRFEPLNTVVDNDVPARLNILLPSMNPRIIFGGYIAVLNFILRVIDKGYSVRIIICEEINLNEEQVRDDCSRSQLAKKVLEQVELSVVSDRSTPIPVSKNDVFVGYSWMTMRLASIAAKSTNDKLPIFFIQEYEAIFHHYDSFRVLCVATYKLPHYAIFNSELLMRFFQNEKLSIFNPKNSVYGLKNNSTFFSHAISDITPPKLDYISNRDKKKLLYYARPEAHAGRNIFEIGLLALREAIMNGTFSEEWEFYGIGSLALHDELSLPNDVTMKILPRVSLEEYCEMMSDFDVGLALMYAPHPSVPPLEMAAAGMITVTTTFENRDATDMQKITGNLIATAPDPESVAQGISEAVERVSDYEKRIENSVFKWPINWDESFNDIWLDNINALLPSETD